jgi:3-(3-hydroxy-phenyl)propionate hydroxylase
MLDRLGVGEAVCAKGVSWNVGRTFFRDDEVYRFTCSRRSPIISAPA